MPFRLVDDGDYETGVFVNSNTSALKIYFDQNSLDSFEQQDLANFLKDTSVTNAYPTIIQNYELGCTRSEYLEKIQF